MINLSEYILLLQNILTSHGDMPIVEYYDEYGDFYYASDPELVSNILVQSDDISAVPIDKAIQVA